MDYGFKPTTNGRELLAACAATGEGLAITRVAVGSGMVPEGVDLADVHQLYEYVADGTIAQRTHENDRLYLTVQYSNADPAEHKSLPTFTLAEFMVYARHPETGEETDLIYGTLGSYLQPVPAFRPDFPASVFSFPLVIVVSDEIEVNIETPAGLVTYEDLDKAVKDATQGIGGIVKTILFTIAPEDWTQIAESSYPFSADIEDEDILASMVPQVILDDDNQEIAVSFKMSATAESAAGYVRLKTKLQPTEEISGVLYLIGKASGGGGGGGYELPTATRTRLGGIKVGTGLEYKSDGTTSVDRDTVTSDVVEDATAPDEDVDEMIDDVFDEENGEAS